MKICSTCKIEKDFSDFHIRKRNHDGLQANCKDCNCLVTKREPDHWRKYNLKRNFGITLEQYNELLEKQNHCCAVCGKHKDEEKKNLAVDHNHKTGEIRGLLCSYCNYRVVGKWTDGNLLRKIASYIEQGTGLFVPKRKRPAKRRPKI